MTRFSPGLLGGLDPYTKVLLHMDGSNGSTTFLDAAKPTRTWTARGAGQVSTAQAKFDQSLSCGNQAGCIDTVLPDADFALGSQDFTVDCWFILTNDTPAACTICGAADATNTVANSSIAINRLPNAVNGKLQCIATVGSTTFICTSGAAITPAVLWRHVAMVRSGTSLLLFLDGVLQQSVAIAGAINTSAGRFAIGRNGVLTSTNVDWAGWIDEFRLSVGIARWTANFTPPSAPYA